MSEAQHFQPDARYCAFCHALAAGTCASCRALVCADCAELVTGGGGKSFAVCTDCRAKGVGSSLVRGWVRLLAPVFVAVLAVGLLLWLLRR